MRTVLKMAFDFAVISGQCMANPVSSIPRHPEKKRDRYLTDDEYKAVWTEGSTTLRAIMDLAYLTGQRNGRNRSYRGVRDLIDRAATKAAVENAHLHDIRAKSITNAKKQGLDAKALDGHATEAQTVRYIRDRETSVVKGPSFRQSNSVLDGIDITY